MAGELYITNPGDSSTFYAIIRRVSDKKVWDVAATDWATWADGDIGNYDVTMSSVGGDLYSGDFPSSISAGTRVLVVFYKQAGGSPAITDSMHLTQDVQWNGSSIVSASSISLDSRALTTLASVKRALSITASTYDTILTELINQVSDRIERECGRRFAAANYNEWVSPYGEACVTVRNWPIIRVDRVRYNCTDSISLIYSGSDVEAYVSVYYDDEGQNGTLKIASISAAGTETSNTFAFSTYPTLSTLVTAADAISGWAVSRISARDGQSVSLAPTAGMDAKNLTAYLPAVVDFDLVAKVNHRVGTIECGRGWGQRLISYRGGYETIPDDVARVANEMVVSAYKLVGLNPLLASESIPDYSYSLASQTDITEQQRRTLDAYRTIAIGGAC